MLKLKIKNVNVACGEGTFMMCVVRPFRTYKHK